jgi:phosphatidylethanolamine-binding protein (PEBP) family uncharacterized protein
MSDHPSADKRVASSRSTGPWARAAADPATESRTARHSPPPSSSSSVRPRSAPSGRQTYLDPVYPSLLPSHAPNARAARVGEFGKFEDEQDDDDDDGGYYEDDESENDGGGGGGAGPPVRTLPTRLAASTAIDSPSSRRQHRSSSSSSSPLRLPPASSSTSHLVPPAASYSSLSTQLYAHENDENTAILLSEQPTTGYGAAGYGAAGAAFAAATTTRGNHSSRSRLKEAPVHDYDGVVASEKPSLGFFDVGSSGKPPMSYGDGQNGGGDNSSDFLTGIRPFDADNSNDDMAMQQEGSRAGAILGFASFSVIGIVTAVVISGLLAWFQTLWKPKFSVYSDWDDRGSIPLKYGCRAKGGAANAMSIPLRWTHVPAGTKSLVLLFANPGSIKVDGTDPVHWFVTNISLTSARVRVMPPRYAEEEEEEDDGSGSSGSSGRPWHLHANASADRHLYPAGATERPNRWNADGKYAPLCTPANTTSLYIVYLYAVGKDPEIATFYDARRIMNRFSGVPTAKLAGYYSGEVVVPLDELEWRREDMSSKGVSAQSRNAPRYANSQHRTHAIGTGTF